MRQASKSLLSAPSLSAITNRLELRARLLRRRPRLQGPDDTKGQKGTRPLGCRPCSLWIEPYGARPRHEGDDPDVTQQALPRRWRFVRRIEEPLRHPLDDDANGLRAEELEHARFGRRHAAGYACGAVHDAGDCEGEEDRAGLGERGSLREMQDIVRDL